MAALKYRLNFLYTIKSCGISHEKLFSVDGVRIGMVPKNFSSGTQPKEKGDIGTDESKEKGDKR